jgi:hypothetical protein
MYGCPYIVRLTKTRRKRWVGHVARVVERRGAYRLLVGKTKVKRPLGRHSSRWEDNIKWIFRKGREELTGLMWLRIGTGGRPF